MSCDFRKSVSQSTWHVNQQNVWDPCLPGQSSQVLVTLPGQPLLLTSRRPATSLGAAESQSARENRLELGWLQGYIRDEIRTTDSFWTVWNMIARIHCVPWTAIKKYDLKNIKKSYIRGHFTTGCFLHSTQTIKIAAWKSSHHIGAPYTRT
jgi:hypothetical protein